MIHDSLSHQTPALPGPFLKKVQEKKQSGLDLTAGTVYFLEDSIC